MKVLKGKDQTGFIDEKERRAYLRNKVVDLPPNIVVSPGDRILIKGEHFDILEYNPSWFSEVAKRGAQIIQSKDAAYIIERTGIRNGSRVLESGVGSGGLSSSLLWSIGNDGVLYSIEVDRGAIDRAKDNVNRMQEHCPWEIIQGDIREIAIPANLDCIILDVPDPWNAIKNVASGLRNGGYIVTYSPTFNQTETTVIALENAAMTVIETVELLKRNILVRPEATRPDHRMLSHTAFITFAVKRSGHSVEI